VDRVPDLRPIAANENFARAARTSRAAARGRRTITLPLVAMDALRMRREAQLEARKSARVGATHDLDFANAVGGPLERQNIQRRSFKPLLKRAGLSHIRFHDFRHSSANLLVSLGEHPNVVQERLGRATIAVTMEIWSHVLRDMQQAAASKLEVFVGSAEASMGV